MAFVKHFGEVLILAACLSAVVVSAARSSCPEGELREVADNSRRCQSLAEERFFVRPTRRGLCHLLYEIVVTCTGGYALCYSDVALLVMRRAAKRVYVDKMMKIYGIGNVILECRVDGVDDTSLAKSSSLQQQQRHPAAHTFTPTEKCNSSAAVHLSVLRYKSCANRVNDALVDEISVTDSSIETRRPIICAAVGSLLVECFPHVASCVDSEAEADELREKQRELLATLFYPMTESLGFSVKQCPIFQRPLTTLPSGGGELATAALLSSNASASRSFSSTMGIMSLLFVGVMQRIRGLL